MESVGDRIRHIRKLHGMNQTAFAKRLGGVTRGAVGNWELGEGISRENIAAIAKKFGVDIAWLMEGIGPRPERPAQSRAETESAIDRDLGLRPPHETVAEIDVRAGAGGGGVPIDAWVHDGDGNTFAAEGIRAHWEIPGEVMRGLLHASPHHVRAFEVIGDSMEPRLHEGDRVFIDLRYTVPSPEGMFALWDGYGVVIKRVQIVRGSEPLRVRVISANPSYEAYEAAVEDIRIIGRYAGRFTTN